MIDLTYYRELQEKLSNKKFLCAYFRLDKKTMLNILQNEFVFVNDEKYKVPEKQLLELLLREEYGETYLQLELIEDVKNQLLICIDYG